MVIDATKRGSIPHDSDFQNLLSETLTTFLTSILGKRRTSFLEKSREVILYLLEARGNEGYPSQISDHYGHGRKRYQDIYLITKKLRSTVHVDIYKNAPTNDHDKGKLAKKIGIIALKKLDKISNEVFKKHNYEALSECVAATICGDIGFITYDLISSEDSLITEIEAEAEPVNNFKITDGDYQFAEIKEFEGNEMIIQALYDWKSIKKKINLKTKKLQQKHIEAFIKYLQGHPYSKIAEMFNVTDGALTNGYNNSGWMAIVRTELIGHLVEYQLTQQGEYYAGYKRIAGNARVDLMSPDKDKAIEVKVREQRETPTAKMLSGEMLKLLEEGFHCELCYCIIRYGKAVFKTYKITKTPYEVSFPPKQELSAVHKKGTGKGKGSPGRTTSIINEKIAKKKKGGS